MPVFPLDLLVEKLLAQNVICRRGNFYTDISPVFRPYFERWLVHRDGFVAMQDSNIDYIGIEEVVRMGAFYNIYFVIENTHITESDDNAHRLFDADPYFKLENGNIKDIGWSGGVIADILINDPFIMKYFSHNIMQEEIRKISIRSANYACIIETRAWEPDGVLLAYPIVEKISSNIRNLISQIHLGEDIAV